ncbi:MAG: DUF2891 family protein [Elusimicrobia bacterium]|nr:DUF2891 family protein [Elusimicrobiota bacterium]
MTTIDLRRTTGLLSLSFLLVLPSARAVTLEEAFDAARAGVRTMIVSASLPQAKPPISAGGPEDVFGADWKTMLEGLARPAADCVARRDTSSAIFHGCVDWHSAVHAFAALSRYTSLTGDRRYAALIDGALTPKGLKEELRSLKQSPSFEMPYGRAWFLKLDVEYRRAFGKSSKELDELADLAARSLVDYYGKNAPAFEDHEYDNASWAFANLADYAAQSGKTDVASFVSAQVEAHFFSNPISAQRFFEPRLMDTLLLSKAIEPARLADWARLHQAELDAQLEPVEPTSPHEAGLNFSRAWGLWSLYRATNDAKYLDAYRALVVWHYRHPQYWRDDYRRHSHWVPQFGIFAIGRAAEAR